MKKYTDFCNKNAFILTLLIVINIVVINRHNKIQHWTEVDYKFCRENILTYFMFYDVKNGLGEQF